MTRTLLVLACVVFVLLLLAGMWWGWINRGKRQADLPELPEVPSALSAALLAPLTGLYVGTTFASSWQDRVVHGGLGVQADVAASWHREGLLLDRAGAEPIFIPVAAITGARLAPGLAGRVVGAGGLLVVSWNLGEHALDTGIRADDKSAYPTWVRTIEASSEESTRSETANSPSLIKEIRHSAEGEDQ